MASIIILTLQIEHMLIRILLTSILLLGLSTTVLAKQYISVEGKKVQIGQLQHNLEKILGTPSYVEGQSVDWEFETGNILYADFSATSRHAIFIGLWAKQPNSDYLFVNNTKFVLNQISLKEIEQQFKTGCYYSEIEDGETFVYYELEVPASVGSLFVTFSTSSKTMDQEKLKNQKIDYAEILEINPFFPQKSACI